MERNKIDVRNLSASLCFLNNLGRICLEEHPAGAPGLVSERSPVVKRFALTTGRSGEPARRGRRKFCRWNKIILVLKGKSGRGENKSYPQFYLLDINNEL